MRKTNGRFEAETGSRTADRPPVRAAQSRVTPVSWHFGLDSFLQQAPAALAIFDREMNYLAHTDLWRAYVPGRRDRVGCNFYEIHPGVPARWSGVCRRALAKGVQVLELKRWDRAAGNEMWLRWTIRPWQDCQDRTAGLIVLAEDITVRKRAVEALHEASEVNRQIISGAKEGIIVYDRNLRYLVWNRFMEQLTGLTANCVLGKHPLEVFPFLEDAGVIDQLKRVLAGAEADPVEFRFEIRQSRQSGWVSDTNSPLRNAAGEIIGVIGLIRDITQRKLTEERIAQLSRAKAILGGIDRAIVHIADRQTLLYEACRLAVDEGGFKLAWIGMVAPDGAVHPVAKAGLTEYLEDIRIVVSDEPAGRGPVGTAIRENRPVVINNVARSRRMAPWLDRAKEFGLHYVAAFPIRLGGRAIGAFQVYAPRAEFFKGNEVDLLNQVSEDISFALSTMSSFAAREQAETELRRSESNLSNFFNQAPIGLVWLSAGGTILRANQAQLDLLGFSADEYLGHAFSEFSLEPGQAQELLERLAAGETVRNFRMSRSCRDGKIRHVLVDGNSFWSDGRFEYFSIFVRDITDRVELERGLLLVGEREHRRLAQDLHDGLGQVLAGTAYLAGTLRQELDARSLPQARQAARIQEAINQAIAQTRSLARGLHPVDPVPHGLMVALRTLAGRTAEMFQVRCRFKCRTPVLLTDNTLAINLFLIAQEAVTNALKHAKPRRVEITLSESAGLVSLSVRDDGTGLPTRLRKKAGVGLRIMRHRAGAIGGTVSVQRLPTRGTAVFCRVPVPSLRPRSGSEPAKV